MSLSDLASLGSFVSGFAVLASLVYAGLQLRGFAKAAHENRVVEYTADIQRFRLAIATDPDVARIYRDGLKDFDGLQSIDQWRFGALMQALVSNFALSIEFRDIASGLDLENNIIWILGRPGARAWWPRARRLFAPSVVGFVDEAFARAAASRPAPSSRA